MELRHAEKGGEYWRAASALCTGCEAHPLEAYLARACLPCGLLVFCLAEGGLLGDRGHLDCRGLGLVPLADPEPGPGGAHTRHPEADCGAGEVRGEAPANAQGGGGFERSGKEGDHAPVPFEDHSCFSHLQSVWASSPALAQVDGGDAEKEETGGESHESSEQEEEETGGESHESSEQEEDEPGGESHESSDPEKVPPWVEHEEKFLCHVLWLRARPEEVPVQSVLPLLARKGSRQLSSMPQVCPRLCEKPLPPLPFVPARASQAHMLAVQRL